ncbi:MAG: DnaJ domain-containing protein [Agathobacter sp.]|nr:DnaJ domain-containing protein [Agathobacter sp.]
MTSEQAFKILEIKDRNIDEASLKKAFYSAARKTHPDSNPKDAQAKAKFHQINEAYEVLREYLKYEKQQKAAADDANKGSRSETAGNAQEKDIWEAYTEADRKYARKRHQEASQKAEETIRNHAKHEKERMKQEQEETQRRRQMEQEAERQRQESGQEQKRQQEDARQQREQEQAERKQHQVKSEKEEARQQTICFIGAFKAWFKRRIGKLLEQSDAVWEKYLKGNRILRNILATVLSATIIVWAGFEIFEGIYTIRHMTSVLVQIAKWILVIWIAYRITAAVHKNWKNRILSVFALLVSMELEITIANWLEDLIRSIHF